MLNRDSKTVLYLSIAFSKKCNLQTGVQTFHFVSGIKNTLVLVSIAHLLDSM